jgi:hypothetical protein
MYVTIYVMIDQLVTIISVSNEVMVVLLICLKPIIRKPIDKWNELTKSWNNTCSDLLATKKVIGSISRKSMDKLNELTKF